MPVILELEIQVIFNYLNPHSAPDLYSEKYRKGVETLDLELNQLDQTILNFILKHQNLIQYVDCGLHIFLKESNLKSRFILAASIVESSTTSFDLFLNAEKVKFPKLQLIWTGIRTTFTMMISFLLFKLKGWN